MFDLQFEDSDGNEITILEFDTIKRGYQSEVKSIFLRNTGTEAINTITLYPGESNEYQVGEAIETYNAMLISLNTIDFLETLKIGLEPDERIEIFCIWRPPSYSELETIPALRIWELKAVINININSEDVC
jgi:hypothetical protein